jgi:hypothetical protein
MVESYVEVESAKGDTLAHRPKLKAALKAARKNQIIVGLLPLPWPTYNLIHPTQKCRRRLRRRALASGG